MVLGAVQAVSGRGDEPERAPHSVFEGRGSGRKEDEDLKTLKTQKVPWFHSSDLYPEDLHESTHLWVVFKFSQ